MRLPIVIWITGLPGSGKTTLAKNLQEKLCNFGLKSIHLDGDEMRAVIAVQDAFDSKSRLEIAKIYQRFAKLLVNQDFTVVVSTVSLFDEILESNRDLFENYFEIFLEVDPDFLISGPRHNQYLEQSNVYTRDIRPNFPKNPNLVLSLSPELDRNHWLDVAFSKLQTKLGNNVN